MGGGGGLAPLLVADRIFFSLFSLSILFHFLVFHLINLFIFVVRTQVWLLAHCQPQFGTFVPKRCPELQAPSPAKHCRNPKQRKGALTAGPAFCQHPGLITQLPPRVTNR